MVNLLRPLLSVILGVTLLMGVALPHPVSAESADWCSDDPIVSINGTIVKIVNGVRGNPAEVRANVAAAMVEIHLPKGVTGMVVGQTSSFFAEPVVFIYDQGGYQPGTPINVQVVVTYVSTREMPALTEITHPRGRVVEMATTRRSTVVDFQLP